MYAAVYTGRVHEHLQSRVHRRRRPYRRLVHSHVHGWSRQAVCTAHTRPCIGRVYGTAVIRLHHPCTLLCTGRLYGRLRPCTWRVHGPVHGTCTRPCKGRVHVSTAYVSTCTRAVYTAVYGPSTRPKTAVYTAVHGGVTCRLYGRVRAVSRRVHGSVRAVCTAVFGRVHWPCTLAVYTSVFGRLHSAYTAV